MPRPSPNYGTLRLHNDDDDDDGDDDCYIRAQPQLVTAFSFDTMVIL